jgi:1,4-alpha-glucan branching enzyme
MPPIQADLLSRRATHFVLWRPNDSSSVPVLVIGKFQPGNPPTLAGQRRITMTRSAAVTGLWEVAANACGLSAGDVAHYWFEVENTNPHRSASGKVLCTDPVAYMVDWRLSAEDGTQPPAVIQFDGTNLTVCDPAGEKPDFTSDARSNALPANNRLVIYELPTAWTVAQQQGQQERGVGTFRDVRALLDKSVGGANFEGLAVVEPGRAYLGELGVNALELLPPADSFFKREWGYDTAHFLSPDHDLGRPDGNTSSTANSDLAALVAAAHRHGIRFFVDMVMAFGRNEPYQTVDFDDSASTMPRTIATIPTPSARVPVKTATKRATVLEARCSAIPARSARRCTTRSRVMTLSPCPRDSTCSRT